MIAYRANRGYPVTEAMESERAERPTLYRNAPDNAADLEEWTIEIPQYVYCGSCGRVVDTELASAMVNGPSGYLDCVDCCDLETLAVLDTGLAAEVAERRTAIASVFGAQEKGTTAMNTADAPFLANILIGSALADGGCTIDRSGTAVESGYVVGGAGMSLVIPRDCAADLDHRTTAVYQWVADAANRYGYLGSWKDDNGRVWLDAVNVVSDEGAARAIAIARGEQAIYNLDAGEEITL